MDKAEAHGIKEILHEVNGYVIEYNQKRETGNSKGEFKDYFKGKYDAYRRMQVVLERYVEWHEIE